jgi:DNA-binding transcriptional MocR family regulator
MFRPASTSKRLNMAGLVLELVDSLNQPGSVNLGASVPPPELLPNRELHRTLAAAARRQPTMANACDPSIGLRSLRVELAKRALEAGCTLAPDDIVITNGATEALHLCLRAITKPGDIYGSLAFDPVRPAVAKSFDDDGLVLLCGSLSKTVAPGYRVGWVVPGKFKAEVHRLKHTCSLGNPTVTQLALADFLATGSYERHLRRLRRTYAQLAERMGDSIARHFPAGTRVTRPRGGQVLWLELPGNVDALELHQAALAQGISIAPGPIFSARQQYRNCIRLNFANPWSEKLDGALPKLGAMVSRSVSSIR